MRNYIQEVYLLFFTKLLALNWSFPLCTEQSVDSVAIHVSHVKEVDNILTEQEAFASICL